MYKINFSDKAKKFLKNLNSKKDSRLIINGISELEFFGHNSRGVKNIGDGIYRKRIGRFRALFTVEKIDKNIFIRIIDMEKDTKKDYSKWKIYIKKFL